jgi:hypothetical protein
MNETIQLNEDDFDEQYPLLENHVNPDASWSIGSQRGCLFETYGKELEFVLQQDPRNVWTLVEGDSGDLWVISGMHLVNRIGYLVSTVPVPADQFIQVHIETPNETEGEDH